MKFIRFCSSEWPLLGIILLYYCCFAAENLAAQQDLCVEKFRTFETSDERIKFLYENADTIEKAVFEAYLHIIQEKKDEKSLIYWQYKKAVNYNLFNYSEDEYYKSIAFLEKNQNQELSNLGFLSARINAKMGQYYVKKISDKEAYFEILNTFEKMEKLGFEKFRYFSLDKSLYQMGKMMYDFGNYDKTLEILLKGEQYMPKGIYTHTFSLNLIQNCYSQKKEYKNAIAYAQKIYDVNYATNPTQTVNNQEALWRSRFWQGFSKLDMASMQAEIGELAEAEKNSEFAYQLCKYQEATDPDKNHVMPEFDALMVLMDIKLKLGKTSEAKSLFQRFEVIKPYLNFSKETDNTYFKPTKLYRNYANYYEATKDYKTALRYIHLAETLEDSLERRNDIKKLTLTKQQFDNERYQSQINDIAEENQKQQRLSFAAIGIMLLVSLIAYLVYRRIKRDKDLIFSQKALLEQSLGEKEILLKEIHHRVKNNLQIISGLLEKQAMKTNDELTRKLMKEGQDRVFSMALVHQNLYQSDNLSSIEIKPYLEMLSKNIQRSHEAIQQKVHLTLEVDNSTIDIDTAIPLGLILNELITNCYKYAFLDKENGDILVSFHQKEDTFFLIVKDNGVGLPDGFDIQKARSLGLNLVRGLVRQLNGKFAFQTNNAGTIFEIECKI